MTNREIARSVVDRMALQGSKRDEAIQGLIVQRLEHARQEEEGETIANLNWTHEQKGFRGGGLFWFDMSQPRRDFIERCRRSTFDDFYDHCPPLKQFWETTDFA